MNFKLLEYQSPEYTEMVALRNKVLREPLGLIFSEEDIIKEADDFFCAVKNHNDKIVACCVLTKRDQEYIKLRQMSVEESFRKKGLGSAVLKYAEQTAKEAGFAKITLHARKEASAFYAKHGYKIVSDYFIEVGIPHIEMEKTI